MNKTKNLNTKLFLFISLTLVGFGNNSYTNASDNNLSDCAYFEQFIDGYGPKGFLPPHSFSYRFSQGKQLKILPSLLEVNKDEPILTVVEKNTLLLFQQWLNMEISSLEFQLKNLDDLLNLKGIGNGPQYFQFDCLRAIKSNAKDPEFRKAHRIKGSKTEEIELIIEEKYSPLCVENAINKYSSYNFQLDYSKARLQDLYYLKDHPEFANQILPKYNYPHDYYAFKEYVGFQKRNKNSNKSYPAHDWLEEFPNENLEKARGIILKSVLDCHETIVKEKQSFFKSLFMSPTSRKKILDEKNECWNSKEVISAFQDTYKEQSNIDSRK